jgi:hypothetical protein
MGIVPDRTVDCPLQPLGEMRREGEFVSNKNRIVNIKQETSTAPDL